MMKYGGRLSSTACCPSTASRAGPRSSRGKGLGRRLKPSSSRRKPRKRYARMLPRNQDSRPRGPSLRKVAAASDPSERTIEIVR